MANTRSVCHYEFKLVTNNNNIIIDANLLNYICNSSIAVYMSLHEYVLQNTLSFSFFLSLSLSLETNAFLSLDLDISTEFNVP